MKKKLLSLASMIRKNWWIAGLCVFFAVAMIILSGFAISASNKAALYIGEERAKAIALEHAGISAAQVTFIKAKLSREDGRIIYDVEFYGENTEYDYEIDAMNGRILEADLDIENYVIPGIQPNTDDQLEYLNPRASSESYIGEERAKSIALEHAGVSVPQVTFIKAKLDYDDGRAIYDVEFYGESTEYDYEIDAVSGTILEADRDIESYSIPGRSSGTQSSNPSSTGNQGRQSQSTPSASSEAAPQYIGEEKAKSIALGHAGVSASNVTFIKAKLGRDDGRDVYDVEFYSGNTEYDYEIDAASGTILEADRDIENYSIPKPPSVSQSSTPSSAGNQGGQPQSIPPVFSEAAPQYIGEERAKSIALSHAGVSASQVNFIKAHLDHDDGMMVYDVEFRSGQMEYDYEIDAVSGAIYKSEAEYDD